MAVSRGDATAGQPGGVGLGSSAFAQEPMTLRLQIPKTHNFLIILKPILFNAVRRELQNYSVLIRERLDRGDKIHVAMCGLATYKCIQTE